MQTHCPFPTCPILSFKHSFISPRMTRRKWNNFFPLQFIQSFFVRRFLSLQHHSFLRYIIYIFRREMYNNSSLSLSTIRERDRRVTIARVEQPEAEAAIGFARTIKQRCDSVKAHLLVSFQNIPRFELFIYLFSPSRNETYPSIIGCTDFVIIWRNFSIFRLKCRQIWLKCFDTKANCTRSIG